jgi:hypothetical protein
MNELSKNMVTGLATSLSLNNKTKEELAEIVDRYPYFGFAQFLLAQTLADESDAGATKQLQHAALYFPNPFWMDYLLRKKNSSINEVVNTIEKNVEEKISSINELTTTERTATEEEKEKTSQNNLDEPDTDLTNVIVDETFQGSNDEITFENADETEIDEGVGEAEREKLSKLIEQHLSEFKKPVDINGDIPLATRVYHAIDYFASQGIKLDPRLLNQDIIGNKVKKFTDWLKQMKRANENPTDLGTDIETEHIIEKIAQSSNEAKDVITETMAEVLKKQGKKEKAIQLYQKLSFLNPSKSTYFAAKINELKSL